MSLAISSKLKKKLADEIEIAGRERLLPSDFAINIANALRGASKDPYVNLMVPLKISASLSSEWGELQYVYCRNCGSVYNLTDSGNYNLAKTMRCSQCKGHLVPAPIWCITADENPNPHPSVFRPFKLIKSVKNVVTAMLSKRKYGGRPATTSVGFRIIIKDLSRPIASLRMVHSGSAEEYDPSTVVKGGQFTYRLALMPSEQQTKPITITAFAYNHNRCLTLEPTAGEFAGVSEMLFCDDIEVVQATVAFRAGHERSYKKVYVFHTTNIGSATVVYIPARCIRTKGLVVRVDRDAVAKVGKDLEASSGIDEWTALHTLSHAFLVKLPQITGLEGGDFGEALSSTSFEIAIFDNSQGGLGGVEGVVDRESKTLTPNYEWAVRESHQCPLACLRACKACLFTDSCYMLNTMLDRRILMALGW